MIIEFNANALPEKPLHFRFSAQRASAAVHQPGFVADLYYNGIRASPQDIAVPHPSLAAADLCVKCGLCLPHCPTYRLSQDESESPRGRLSLMQAWAEDKLVATPTLLGHVDNCLGCRRCETVCPAKVPYGRLLDDFRAAQSHSSDGLRGCLARWVLSNAAGRARLASLARRYGQSSWRGWLRRFSPAPLEALAHTAEPLLPRAFYPAQGRETARVALFVGCTGDWLDADALRAAIAVLTRLGVAVTLPAGQGCCGALHWHAGKPAAAAPLLKNNQTLFADADTVLTIASGCGAFLREQGGLGKRIIDINRFLLDLPWPEDVQLQSLSAKAALHTPCSQNDGVAVSKLLGKIPGLQISPLPAQPACCGAAGTYMLDHGDWAKRLRNELIDAATSSGAAYLVTSNVGCATHLRAGLDEAGVKTLEVLHPVALLARCL